MRFIGWCCRTLFWLSLPLLFVLASPAQSVYGGAYRSSSTPHALSGTVINSATGEAVPYALVQVGPDAVLSDQNGQFRFDALNYSQASIIAHKPGFFSEGELGDGWSQPVALSSAETTVTVRLVPEAVVAGHVEDMNGDPIESLPVRLRYARVMNGRMMWQQERSRGTDEDGNFRIANLRPGTYYVEVGPSFQARMVAGVNGKQSIQVYPSEYYPGVPDRSSATALRLSAGQHASIEVDMKSVPGYRISGFVARAGSAGTGVMLLDDDEEPVPIRIRTNPQTGKFEGFPVPAGSYHLRATGQDSSGQQIFADFPISITGDMLNLRVPVERAVNIPVHFNKEFTDSNSTESNTVYRTRGNTFVGPAFLGQIRLVSRASPNIQYWSTRDANSDFGNVLHGVRPGTYDVQVIPNGGSYVASMSWGGADLLQSPLVVPENADPQPIEIALRDDGASVQGSVQLPTNERGAQVLLIATHQTTSPMRPIFVDPSGNFHAQELAPGDYEVLAFDRLDGIEYDNREALNAYLSHATHITLSAGEQAKVTVDLIRTSE